MNPLKIMLKVLKLNNLKAFLIKISDHHLSEYISEADKYLEHITGFTGSNGVAIITEEENVLFTDGRYFIQAEKELKDGFKLKKYGIDETPAEYLNKLGKDINVGLDKRTFSHENLKKFKKETKENNFNFMHFELENLDLPMHKRVFNKIIDLQNMKLGDLIPDIGILSEDLVGKSREEKIKEVRENLKDNEVFVITELDSIAWLFNLRGSDIEYNPVFYSYTIITKDEIQLFLGNKMEFKEEIKVKDYNDFEEEIKKHKKIIVSHSCNSYISGLIENIEFNNFLVKMKSKKNEVEINGFLFSHLLDGIALVMLFGWIEKEIKVNPLKEIVISRKLKELKMNIKGFKEESFETICGGGPNSAIIHHKACDYEIKENEIILIDSGSQYYFGTTDVTRTLHFGTPTKKEKEMYTKVLKGVILAKRFVWKKDTSLKSVDILARYHLWQGFDNYEHGTSHGVGYFLNVHESPPDSDSVLEEGQVISIEPGYYKENEFGIRIEDLVLVKKTQEKDYYKFETLTFVPLHLKLIDVNLLDDSEIEFINFYSKSIREKLIGFVKDTDGYSYLMKNTTPIVKISD